MMHESVAKIDPTVPGIFFDIKPVPKNVANIRCIFLLVSNLICVLLLQSAINFVTILKYVVKR